MIKKVFIIIILGVLYLNQGFAQLSSQDLTTLKVESLSDSEIKSYYDKAKAANLSDKDILNGLMQRGLPASEATLLQQRFERLNGVSNNSKNESTGNQSPNTGRQVNSSGGQTLRIALDSLEQQIYGMELFTSPSGTFNPDLRIATPSDYLIGPDDELLINVYGYAESSEKAKVSPDGYVNIKNVGPVFVSGLLFEEAKTKIIRRLASTIYPTINSGRTQVQITLGNIRTIRVIVTGQARMPGTYNVSSLSTVFSALFLAGGPSVQGSFRNIELRRAGKKVHTIDLYEYLHNGDVSGNVVLKDNDVINIPYYQGRIKFTGEVKRAGYYELNNKERLDELMAYAGGFGDSAYKAQVRILQLGDIERKVQVLGKNEIGEYKPSTGDEIIVEKILNRYGNRVILNGAVARPGYYDLTPGLTVKQLIDRADGINEYAFTSRAGISRLLNDQTRRFISFNISDVISGKSADIPLTREDIVIVPSMLDLRDSLYLDIEGAVRRPGRIYFKTGMTIKDAIIEAGGFTEGASGKRLEIGRRILNEDESSDAIKVAEVINVDSDKDLNANINSVPLNPFDIVVVRNNPGYVTQRGVAVNGEAKYPGKYILETKNDRISDVIVRAGGLTGFADANGVSLKRMPKAELDTSIKKSTFARLDERKNTQSGEDTTTVLATSNIIGINLPEILKHPHSPEDIVLEDGDQIIIPKKDAVVKVHGEILYPSQFSYIPGQSIRYYVNRSGGFTNNSLRKRSYLISLNGNAKRTSHFLFFRKYPRVNAGDEIFVPRKPEKKSLSTGEIIGITSGVASLAGVIIAILNLTK